MSAKERLAHIKALGFTIDQEMIDRENRVDEYGQENLCNRIVADLAPEFDKFRYAIATAYTVDDEQAADAEWLGESPDDPDGTEPSPIVSGGEVLYRNYQSNGEVPF